MSEQLKASTIRAMYGAVMVAALDFLVTYQIGRGSEYRLEDALLAFGTVFVGYMIARGAAEGVIDTYRNSTGKVSKADVGQPS